jgi:gliding motility-associated-like protein
MYKLSFLVLLLTFCMYTANSQCTQGDFSYTDTCFSNVTTFTGIGLGSPSLWKWNFGDPASGANDSATGATPTHIFKSQGNYQVSFFFPNACDAVTKTITITTPLAITLSLKDTMVCDTPFVLDAGIAGLKYLWSSGDTIQKPSLTAKGKYWAKVFKNGCYATDTIDVKVWGQGNKGNYNWYFGDKAGLNFKGNSPTVITTSKDSTYGGSAAISDPNGKILFYTDGRNIYNKNNQIMTGGTGVLAQDTSQATLIVPDARANNIYYVFATNPIDGLTYSIVDLSYNNGLGKVTQENIPLASPVTEQIAGVKDSTGNSFWAVTHGVNNNEFISYRIGKAGLDTTKVISNVGSTITGTDGYIKFSEDGSLAAVTMPNENRVEIYNFNTSTGKFTLKDTITNITDPFGVEFSDDNSKIYVSTQVLGNSHIYQYNISKASNPLIMASKYDLTPNSSSSYGALQMGPDQKIYVAIQGSSTLAVINNPDQDTTSASFQQTGVDLGNGKSNLGLTNFIANHFKTSSWSLADADTCVGMTTLFQANAPDSVTKWVWHFGDGSTSTTKNPTNSHKYPGPGIYHFSVDALGPCKDTTLSQTVHIIAYPVPAIHDTLMCSPITYTLNAGNNPGAGFLWSTGSTNQIITTDTTGTYQVTVAIGQCATTKTATVTFAPVNSFDLGNNQTLCNGDSVVLNSLNPGLTHQWSTGVNSQSIVVKTSGSYSVTVTNGGKCPKSDNIQLTFITPPTISLGPPNQVICIGNSKTLDAGTYNGFHYLWSTGDTTHSIIAKTSSLYGVKVYQGKCASGDTIQLTVSPGPSIQLPGQEIICTEQKDTVTLNSGLNVTGVPAVSYHWSPGGETSPSLTVTSPGTYSLIAYDVNQCPSPVASSVVLDICEARIFIPNIFSPNGDGRNDEFKIAGANITSFHLELFDRWGELIFVSNDINTSWDGMYRGNIVEEGAYVWKITYAGETVNGIQSKTKTGDVTVIR